jgi:replicative DNA helicase
MPSAPAAVLYDKQTEEMLLGAFLLRPELLDEPWALVSEEVFMTEANRMIYRIMRSQMDTHAYVGVHTVVMDLRLADRSDLCVYVPGLLAVFCDSHPENSDIAELCASRLTDLYRARETDFALANARQKARDGVPLTEVQMEVEALLRAINSTDGDSNMPSIDELLEQMETARVVTGYSEVDRITGGGMTNSDLNIVAARPSVGKSGFARGIIRRFIRSNKRVFWLSQDQSISQILELEIARFKSSDTDKVRTMSRESKREALVELLAFWRDRLVLIDKPLKLPDILTAARFAQPDLVVIDYLQIVNTGNHEEYDSVTLASKAFKGLAQELGVPVLALAQFNRQFKTGEIPSLAHLRSSGQIEQDAAQVWALDRDTTLGGAQSQEAQLYVLKNKTGPTGKATLTWVGRYASYESAAVGGMYA